MQILENGILETFVLTISLAEALNGQYLGRGRQFKKALCLVLLVSQIWVWTASGKKLLCLVSFCAFQCPIPSRAVDTLLRMSRIRQEDEVWMCVMDVWVCVIYAYMCVAVHVLCMCTCVCCVWSVCTCDVCACVLCIYMCYYVWCMLWVYIMCMCVNACVWCACVGRVCMHICEHTLHLFVYQLKGFFWHMSYVDKVGLKLTVYPWVDELELIFQPPPPCTGVTGLCCQTWFMPCSGWSF